MQSRPGELIVVGGPTASGKSLLATRLALAIGGEVLSADAFSIYRELRIGVARPSEELLEAVPHHLVATESVMRRMTVGRFVELGREILEEVAGRNKTAVIEGGTGLYVTALLSGLPHLPVVSRRLRGRVAGLVRRFGPVRAHRLLSHVDPVLAARLPPGDRQRIQRGIEVYFHTGQTLSSLQKGEPEPLDPGRVSLLCIRRNRADLNLRIASRTEEMWRLGLIEEVRRLAEAGLRDIVLELKPIGYREAFAVLEGALTVEEATSRIVAATRRLVKRQMTWWRRRQPLWLSTPAGGEPDVSDALALLSKAALKNPVAAPWE